MSLFLLGNYKYHIIDYNIRILKHAAVCVLMILIATMYLYVEYMYFIFLHFLLN